MSGVRPDAFERVVKRFFEAAVVPDLWPEVLHDLAQACGAVGATALPISGAETVGVIASREAREAVEAGLRAGWYMPEHNSRMAGCMALVSKGWRGFITERDAFSPEALRHDPFHQEFLRPHGFASFAGAMVVEAPGLALAVSIERRIVEGVFERDEVDLMSRLFAHLRSASDLAMRIGMTAARRTAEAFAATGQAVALIGRDGRVLHMNDRFERLIGDGIHVKAGRVGSWHPDANRALAAAVARALRHDGTLREPLGAVVLPRRDGLRPLVAQVAPTVGLAHDVMHLVAAVVTLTDLEAAAAGPAETTLVQAFGLSPAEARLAASIASGRTLAEIAQEDGTARETLRTRLKVVFDKTGTGRQAELALLLSRLVPTAG